MDAELTLAESVAGRCGSGVAGRPVGLPVEAVASGSGLVAGEPTAGATGSTVTLVDALCDHGIGCLVVDADATLCGRVSSDLERWSPRGGGPDVVGGRVATAVDGGESFVLDLSDRREPGTHLDAAARALAEAARDADRRWVLVVADVDRFVPADRDGDAAGETLGRLAAGGRNREIGLLSTVDSPAAVDSALVEACEWRLWHRLSSTADRSVVRRLVDGEHARAVRDLEPGEAILDAAWRATAERIAVDRPTGIDDRPGRGDPTDDPVSALRADVDEILERLDRLQAAVGAGPDDIEASSAVSAPETDTLAPPPPSAEPDDGLAALAGVGDDEVADDPDPTDRRLVGDGGPDLGSVADELSDFEAGVAGVASSVTGAASRSPVAVDLETTLSDLKPAALSMLRVYRADGPLEPETAARRATGREDRVEAYRTNRRLRRAGLVEHVGRGRYAYALEARVAAGLPAGENENAAAVIAADLEAAYLD